MFEVDINFMAVLAATVVSMVVNVLWFSPFLFGNAINKLAGEDCPGNATALQLIGGAVTSFLTAVLLAYFIELTAVADPVEAVIMALALWLGFSTTTLFAAILWKRMPFKFFLIRSGFYLVTYVLMSVVITLITYR
jgi:hypothetical protein